MRLPLGREQFGLELTAERLEAERLRRPGLSLPESRTPRNDILVIAFVLDSEQVCY